MMYLGLHYVYTKSWSSWVPWPPGGVSQKCKSAILGVTMTATVTKLLHFVYLMTITSHELWVSELTYLSRSLRSKFEISLPGGTFCYYLTERAVIWCNDVYTVVTYYARAKFSPIRFLIWPPGVLPKNADWLNLNYLNHQLRSASYKIISITLISLVLQDLYLLFQSAEICNG